MKTSHILLWSGGFDSTAILLKMVGDPTAYPKVRLISCGLKNANNYKEDKEAREKIIEILKLKDNNQFEIINNELEVISCLTLQSPVWAWLSVTNISRLDSGIKLCYGFIRGDDFWHYRLPFEEAIKNMVAISADGMKLEFQYPLEWLHKKEFLKWYINFPEVFKCISWGGDTASVKLKEREDLEFTFNEMVDIKHSVLDEEKMKKKESYENKVKNDTGEANSV